jgi:hypothetical protein
MASPTKLRSVIEEAKQHLRDTIASHESQNASPTSPPEEAGQPARSKLNTLLGKQTVEQRPVSLFQSVGVPQRPTYDLIANRVLGPNVPEHRSFLDEGSAYADHVAQRLRALQERLNTSVAQEEAVGTPSAFVGVEDDGRPVWSQVLDEQRGRPSNALSEDLSIGDEGRTSLLSSVVEAAPSWPARLSWSSQRTFKQWFVAEENFEATQLCEAAIDQPAQRFNPLFLEAKPQSGCSLLLHATGQAWLRRSEGHVMMLGAADVSAIDPTEVAWKDALPGATALIVDDLHEFARNESWRHQLGLLLDHALNLGIQVLVGGRSSPSTLPASRLKEVLQASTTATLHLPSVPTLMAFARWRCVQKNLLMSDIHLAQLARMEPSGWGAVQSRLEHVALATERGEVLLDHDPLDRLFASSPTPIETEREVQRVEDVAATLVGEVLDSVYSSVEPGGIDLHADIEPWGEDVYTPPAWDEGGLASDQTRAFEEHLAQTVANVTPGRPTVLDVHERERHLISNRESLEGEDLNRTVDALVDLDTAIDERMMAGQLATVATTSELNQLEDRMVSLAQRAMEADIEELISIADELRALEERLVELDPDRAPLPPFEEDVEPSQRRKVNRRRKPTSTPLPTESTASLEEYEPEGEWNIDGEGISADDLLEKEPAPLHRVPLARLRPRKVLVGEEE